VADQLSFGSMKAAVALALAFTLGVLVGRWTLLKSTPVLQASVRTSLVDEQTAFERAPVHRSSAGAATLDGNSQVNQVVQRPSSSISIDPHFREPITRGLALDYAEFVVVNRLDRQRALLLNELLVDDFFARSEKERAEVAKLIEDLLGAALTKEYLEYRKMLPQLKAGRRVASEFKTKFPSAEPAAIVAAEEVAKSLAPPTSTFDRLRVQATFTEDDILKVEKEHRQAVAHVLSKASAGFTTEQLAFLEDRMIEASEMKEQMRLLRMLLKHNRRVVP
jgi:hypothetical protein